MGLYHFAALLKAPRNFFTLNSEDCEEVEDSKQTYLVYDYVWAS